MSKSYQYMHTSVKYRTFAQGRQCYEQKYNNKIRIGPYGHAFIVWYYITICTFKLAVKRDF